MSKRTQHSTSCEPAGKRPRGLDDDEVIVEEPENVIDLNSSQSRDIQPVATKKEGEVGVVEQIILKNFMNHTRLEFKFGPQINFVIGRNGSGKSAIVTALVVGLGGKASVTNRGSSVKGFIKTGKQVAEISIKLRNRGTDAYKADTYGDAIIVERKISAEGSNPYKIKSKDGRVISQKKEELDRILDQFNIQIDNPIAVLNQETSKNFLHSKNPKDKYKFFLKATQLEQMKHDYARANEEKAVISDIIEQKVKSLPSLEKEVHEWKRKYDALGSLVKLKEKVEQLKREATWATVGEKEKVLETTKKEFDWEQAKMPKFEAKVKESVEKEKTSLQTLNTIQNELKEMIVNAKGLQPQHAVAKKDLMDKKNIARRTQGDLQRVQNEIKSLNRDKNEIFQRIQELKNSAQQDFEAEKQEREDRLAQLTEDLHTLNGQKKTTEHQQDQFKSAVNKAKEDSYKIKGEISELQQNIERTKRNLTSLQASRSNRLQRFGDHVPRILEKIEIANRRGQFHKKPKGPLGAFIKVREDKWALGVEKCVGPVIQAFCCHDFHDEQVLQGIVNAECTGRYRKPSIITSKFQDRVYDVKYKAQTRDFPTVYDMIDVDDATVMNVLIDQRSIESIILIEDSPTARDVIKNRPPRNCNQAFTLVGDQVLKEPTFRYYSNQEHNPTAKYLGGNVDSQIEKYKQEQSNYQTDLAVVQQNGKEIDMDIRNNQTQDSRGQQQLMKIGEKIRNTEREINELQSVEEPTPEDVSTLEEEVAGLEEQIQRQDERRENLRVKMDEEKQAIAESQQNYDGIDSRLKEVADNADPLKEDLAEAERQIEKAKHDKNHYQQKLNEQQRRLRETEKSYEESKAVYEDTLQKAERICEKVKTRRKVREIELEIEEYLKRVREEEKQRGNADEITKMYHERSGSYTKIKKEIDTFKNFLESLRNIIEKCNTRWVILRGNLCVRVKIFFSTLYSKFENKRQSAPFGILGFDHEREELDIQVQPSSSHKETTADMKSLSGGERSFATVCFILSLWEAMESPFRVLDEFDVFMDLVNRRTSMDMMLEEARSQCYRQFVFLTPLNMSELKPGPELKIYRMPDPERGQGVLPESFHPPNDADDDDETQK